MMMISFFFPPFLYSRGRIVGIERDKRGVLYDRDLWILWGGEVFFFWRVVAGDMCAVSF